MHVTLVLVILEFFSFLDETSFIAVMCFSLELVPPLHHCSCLMSICQSDFMFSKNYGHADKHSSLLCDITCKCVFIITYADI